MVVRGNQRNAHHEGVQRPQLFREHRAHYARSEWGCPKDDRWSIRLAPSFSVRFEDRACFSFFSPRFSCTIKNQKGWWIPVKQGYRWASFAGDVFVRSTRKIGRRRIG